MKLLVILDILVVLGVAMTRQDGGERPTGQPRASLGHVAQADCRPGFVIASGKLRAINSQWHVGGITIALDPNQIPGDAQLQRFDGTIVEIIVRNVR